MNLAIARAVLAAIYEAVDYARLERAIHQRTPLHLVGISHEVSLDDNTFSITLSDIPDANQDSGKDKDHTCIGFRVTVEKVTTYGIKGGKEFTGL